MSEFLLCLDLQINAITMIATIISAITTSPPTAPPTAIGIMGRDAGLLVLEAGLVVAVVAESVCVSVVSVLATQLVSELW